MSLRPSSSISKRTRVLPDIAVTTASRPAKLPCNARTLVPGFKQKQPGRSSSCSEQFLILLMNSGAMANVVYREIVDYERVVEMVLAHRTRESAPAVLAFVEACKGLRA